MRLGEAQVVLACGSGCATVLAARPRLGAATLEVLGSRGRGWTRVLRGEEGGRQGSERGPARL
eukprot:2009495-Alexandrium_andersonii.AAC.1